MNKILTTQEYFNKKPTREERTAHINLNEDCQYMGFLAEEFMTHPTKTGGKDRETRIPRAISAYAKGHEFPNIKRPVIINGVKHKVETNHACKGECTNPAHIYTGTKRENDDDRMYGFSKTTRKNKNAL